MPAQVVVGTLITQSAECSLQYTGSSEQERSDVRRLFWSSKLYKHKLKRVSLARRLMVSYGCCTQFELPVCLAVALRTAQFPPHKHLRERLSLRLKRIEDSVS